MNKAQPTTAEEPLYPSRCVFVVQFVRGSSDHGYVEHVASGRNLKFKSRNELFAFIDQENRTTENSAGANGLEGAPAH